jgi:hypothetical protein
MSTSRKPLCRSRTRRRNLYVVHPSRSRTYPIFIALTRIDAVYKRWASEHGSLYRMKYTRDRHSMWQSRCGSPTGGSAYRSHNHDDARHVLQSLHDWAMSMSGATHVEAKFLALLWGDRGPMFQIWLGHMVKLLSKHATPEHARSETKQEQPSMSIVEDLVFWIIHVCMPTLGSLHRRETTIGFETRSNIERRKAELSCLASLATQGCSIYPTTDLKSIEQVLSHSYYHLVIIVPVTLLLCSYPSLLYSNPSNPPNHQHAFHYLCRCYCFLQRCFRCVR